MKKFIFSVLITLFVALLFSCKEAPVRDELWDAYSDTLNNFQHNTFKVMSAQLPEESQLLAKYRDYNLLQLEEKTMKFYYFLEHHPERIIRNQKLYDFVNLKWANEDRKVLHKSMPESAALERRIFGLWREIEPDWEILRKKMETVYQSDEYKAMQKQHGKRLREFEDRLISNAVK